MTENDVARIILDYAFYIHRQIGPGLLESVYEEILAFELSERSLLTKGQFPFSVVYEGQHMNLGFRADLIVDEKVIVEIKSIEALAPVHKKQVLTYLRLTGLKLGLLINFNEALLKDGIVRIVNKL